MKLKFRKFNKIITADILMYDAKRVFRRPRVHVGLHALRYDCDICLYLRR